ncbi:mitochondrial ribosomal protein S9 [Calliopsis andreniformis]|uniref:mitochondrial ribosomal protein S9 n=1 Tax=Calliopsis andreniformis TaxID=337506 RepID=UPI003FCEA07D
MAVSMFTRFGIVRNLMNVNNISAIGGALNIRQYSNVKSTSYKDSIKEIETLFDDVFDPTANKNMSKAMKIYLERTRQYNKLMEIEKAKYEIGKRHLANMMGEDPETFTQTDIERAIQYLLPSGIYDRQARPLMLHPNKLFQYKKEAQFDETGRPFHFLFYTCNPRYYEILHNIAETITYMNREEDKRIINKNLPSAEDKFNEEGTTWVTKNDLQTKLMERLTDKQYDYFIKSMDRVMKHPLSKLKSDFIMQYRIKISTGDNCKLLPFQYVNGRPFTVSRLCKRKSARAEVKVIGNGSGNISINGQDITYFKDKQSREQYKYIHMNLLIPHDIYYDHYLSMKFIMLD